MEKSILEFQKNGIPSLEKIIINFFEDPTKIAEFVGDVRDNVLQLGLNIIESSDSTLAEGRAALDGTTRSTLQNASGGTTLLGCLPGEGKR